MVKGRDGSHRPCRAVQVRCGLWRRDPGPDPRRAWRHSHDSSERAEIAEFYSSTHLTSGERRSISDASRMPRVIILAGDGRRCNTEFLRAARRRGASARRRTQTPMTGGSDQVCSLYQGWLGWSADRRPPRDFSPYLAVNINAQHQRSAGLFRPNRQHRVAPAGARGLARDYGDGKDG